MKLFIPCFVSFLLTAVITPSVIRLATKCKCLDMPGERRLHNRITPRWGGAAFFAGVLPFLLIENENNTLTSYIAASCIIVVMGMIDDLKSLGWKSKFAGMAVATTIVISGGDIAVHSIEAYGPFGRVELGWLSIPFTFLSIIGITNAINLLDGLDGLAGGVSLLGFLFMGIAATLAGNLMIAVICFAFVGALAAFLLFNFPNAKIFMGDTGSLFLGFSLSIMSLLLTQGPKSSVDSMFPVLVLLIPIFDTLRVLLVRLLNGKNPFKADNLHLHYLIVQKNVAPANVTLLFWSLTAVFGSIGLVLTNSPPTDLLNVTLYASSLLGLITICLTYNRRTVQKNHSAPPLPVSMETVRPVFTRHETSNTSFTRKGELMKVKWTVILGVLLLPAQAFAGETARLRIKQDKVICNSAAEVERDLNQAGNLPETSLVKLKSADFK